MARARTRKPSKRSVFELKSDSLRWECNPNRLGFETTADLRFKPDIIGQERALDAMRLGLTIRSPGYNIFISGLMGTGKLTAIRHMLDLESAGLRIGEHALVESAGRVADNLIFHANPAVQACKRLGLPADYLYRRSRA